LSPPGTLITSDLSALGEALDRKSKRISLHRELKLESVDDENRRGMVESGG
jgi:hypothetical protein